MTYKRNAKSLEKGTIRGTVVVVKELFPLSATKEILDEVYFSENSLGKVGDGIKVWSNMVAHFRYARLLIFGMITRWLNLLAYS